jgi:small subunit ribosomal protein S5
MSDEIKQQEAKSETEVSAPVAEVATTDAPAGDVQASATARPVRRGGDSADSRRNPRRARRGNRREERVRSEFDQKIISIRRVTRVMAGGRRFSFSVAIVIGNRKGKVGVGIGKAGDTQLAIEKAVRSARKNLIEIPLNKHQHIPHDVKKKLSSSEVMIIPAPGKGLVAGSSVRTVLELGGVKDVTAKIFSRSKNKLNNARAAIAALKMLKA